MSLRKLPELKVKAFDPKIEFEPRVDAIDRWNAALRPAAAQSGTVIEIYDIIGFDFWTGEGVTAKSISAKLKNAGDITVNINSPGGDFFEGIAIYNLLRAHQGRVDVNIMGLAASAASIIAEAGDSVKIGKAASFMIHNAWGLVIGNKSDMAKAADDFAVFDGQMAGLYADRTGKSREAVAALLDAETWMGGEEAVAEGFADALLDADQVIEDAKALSETKPITARRRVDAMLAERGLPRSERRAMIRDLKNSGTLRAAEDEAMPRADFAPLAASLKRLHETLKH